ncbi:MAG: hypothetical protein LBU26_03945 [Synergistaceae bacterium]|nr:hypothetical protein [Synergistaceae bacterium]
MNGNAAIDYYNPNNIRKMGIKALTKELGPVGMAHFIRQFEQGEGDYTAERDALLTGTAMEDFDRYLADKKQ